MTAKQSNLTAEGYNLVSAVTQTAVNKTMETYLTTLNGVIDWYIITPPPSYQTTETLTAAQFAEICPVNPLTVPSGTSTAGADDDIAALYAAGFQYGIQAVTGIGADWTSVPDVVVIDQTGTTVKYQMYFATMQVVELIDSHGILTYTNCSQPATSPWIFTYLVNLALDTVTGTEGTPPPQSDLFSVQALYVDLTDATGSTQPSISGVSPSCMDEVQKYVNAYVATIPSGQSTISYAQTDNSTTHTASLTVTNLQFAATPATATSAATIDYLCMSSGAKAPDPLAYPTWSWLSADDTASGVMAVERIAYATYLISIFNTNFNLLSSQTDGEAVYKDKAGDCQGSFEFTYTCPAPNPGKWVVQPDTTSPVIATASYEWTSGNQHSYSSNCTYGSISCDWNYELTASLTTSTDANGVPHILMEITLLSPVHVHFCGSSKDKNVVNLVATVDYTLGVTQSGEITVSAKSNIVDQSETISELKTSCGNITFGSCNDMYSQIDTNLKNAIAYYENNVLSALQNAMAWYFPGSETFAFRDLAFSDYGDLTVKLDYLSPT